MAAILTNTHRLTLVKEEPEGSADPIGDDQAERSGWGGLDECCATEGGCFCEPSSTYRRMTLWQRFCRWLAST